jgi:hypothetical protein
MANRKKWEIALTKAVEKLAGLNTVAKRAKYAEGMVAQLREANLEFFSLETSVAWGWDVDDVIERASERGINLEYDKAKEILRACRRNHDSTIGMNWDVIDCHIEDTGA